MSSTITNYSALIDTAFPVAGVDNDIAGFHSNSINTVASFTIAAQEISNLQSSQEGLEIQLNNATTTILNSLTNVVTYSTSTPATSVGAVGDKPGMIYATSSSIYVCYSPYTGASNIWAKVNTVGATWP
jgi:hypothetical protein